LRQVHAGRRQAIDNADGNFGQDDTKQDREKGQKAVYQIAAHPLETLIAPSRLPPLK
jgi:hypothetical protein